MSDNLAPTQQREKISYALRSTQKEPLLGINQSPLNAKDTAQAKPDEGDVFWPIGCGFLNRDSWQGWANELNPEQLKEVEIAIAQIRGI